MTRFNWYKAIGFGLGIWVILFALAALAFGVGIFASIWTQLAIAAIMAVVTYAFASATESDHAGHSLGYGVMFAAIGIVLDLVISRQLVSGLFSMWTYYVTYAAIVLAPIVQLGFGRQPSARAI